MNKNQSFELIKFYLLLIEGSCIAAIWTNPQGTHPTPRLLPQPTIPIPTRREAYDGYPPIIPPPSPISHAPLSLRHPSLPHSQIIMIILPPTTFFKRFCFPHIINGSTGDVCTARALKLLYDHQQPNCKQEFIYTAPPQAFMPRRLQHPPPTTASGLRQNAPTRRHPRGPTRSQRRP